MSGHNVLQEVLDAEHTLIPPSLNGTASVDRSPALLVSEVNCKIAVPQRTKTLRKGRWLASGLFYFIDFFPLHFQRFRDNRSGELASFAAEG